VDKCAFHPVKQAVARCKRCHTPICRDCQVKAPDGIFCSHECVEEFRNFQSQMYSGPVRKSGISIFGLIKSLIISAVLIAIIWFVLNSWLGAGGFGEMGSKLRQMLKLLF
jgi:hypothetical protein